MNLDSQIVPKKKQDLQVPGEVGVWVLIFGDLVIFSLLFLTFMYYRAEDSATFARSHATLNQTFGVLNVALMLSSSLFVALAVNAARTGRARSPTMLYALALLCGATFVVVKVFEYGEKLSAGIGLNTDYFFMLYFVLTGIHLLHVVVGMGVLVFLGIYAHRRAGSYMEDDIRTLESGSCFWHVVDLLWIVLFALIYLVK